MFLLASVPGVAYTMSYAKYYFGKVVLYATVTCTPVEFGRARTDGINSAFFSAFIAHDYFALIDPNFVS